MKRILRGAIEIPLVLMLLVGLALVAASSAAMRSTKTLIVVGLFLASCAGVRPVPRARPTPAPHVSPGATLSPLPVAP